MLTKTIAFSRKDIPRSYEKHKDILFPPNNGLVKYQSLDFTLMYTICRNVLHEEIEPDSKKNGRWGKSPDVGDTSLLAAIERIRECRNSFFAHATTSEIKDAEFNRIWTTVAIAVNKISENIDQTIAPVCYKEKMKILKSIPIEPEDNKNLKNLVVLEKKWQDQKKPIKKKGNILYYTFM